jgi:hypothetical protein
MIFVMTSVNRVGARNTVVLVQNVPMMIVLKLVTLYALMNATPV